MTHFQKSDLETDELELTAEELRQLASQEMAPKVSVPVPSLLQTSGANGIVEWADTLRQPAGYAPSKIFRRRIFTVPMVAVAASSLIALSIIVVAAQRAQQEVPLQPTRWHPTANQESEPVLIENPFDEQEIFEFPAGTSESTAREAVADVLLERARGRQ